MTAVLAADGLGKRFGRRWALADCSLEIPAGRVVGLVGPNGAGKSTLLNLAVGLLRPTAGTITVLGDRPARTREQLGRVGFVAQDSSVYAGLTVADHLRYGASTNARWDESLAQTRMRDLGLDPKQRAGRLSGGQRAQLALTMAMAKRPQLLVLDEPVASLDPLARRDFLSALMGFVADHATSVLLSSHLIADLERVCDHLVVLDSSRVTVSGDVDALLSSHRRLVGPRRTAGSLPANQYVVDEQHTERQSVMIVRTSDPVLDPAWTVEDIGVEDLVLAYMGLSSRATTSPGASLTAVQS